MINYKKKYLRKAKFWAKILGKMPGILAIFLSGSLAQNRAKKSSDIDFFIITKKERIWTARFFIFTILKIFGLLSRENKHTGQICPNHFITETSLEIREKNAYAANLFAHNIPLYDPYNLFIKFKKINEPWTLKFREKFQFKQSKKCPPKKIPKISKSAFFTNFIEKISRNFQIKKIQKNQKKLPPHAVIILENDEIRLHPNPKSLHYKPKK